MKARKNSTTSAPVWTAYLNTLPSRTGIEHTLVMWLQMPTGYIRAGYEGKSYILSCKLYI